MQRNTWSTAALFLAAIVTFPCISSASEPTVAEEILEILRSSGQISQDQYDVLLTKAQDEERTRIVQSEPKMKSRWTDRIIWYADFRGRAENFSYEDDPDGTNADDRTRLRYRARIGVNAKINDYIGGGMRLVTGEENTTTNQTVGGGGDNFDKNEVGFDRAYIYYEPYGMKQKPDGLSHLKFTFGKMGAPFLSNEGKDYLFWDSDVAPEGFHGTVGFEPRSNLKITAKAGYFIEDENKDSKDPHLSTVQLIGNLKTSDHVRIGAAGSYYAWSSLNDRFMDENEWVDGGLSDDDSIAFYDLRTWVAFDSIKGIPMKVYGNYLVNTDAEGTLETDGDDEGTAWMVGIEGGDKKKLVKLGLGYAEVETNSVLASYTDSDFFDGKSNRKGFVVYGQRQITKGADFKITLFHSKPLDDDIDVNLSKSERLRIQSDIVFKF